LPKASWSTVRKEALQRIIDIFVRIDAKKLHVMLTVSMFERYNLIDLHDIMISDFIRQNDHEKL